jgi:hypothetical protein
MLQMLNMMTKLVNQLTKKMSLKTKFWRLFSKQNFTKTKKLMSNGTDAKSTKPS